MRLAASSTWSASRPESRDTPVKENSGKIAGQPRQSSGAIGGLTRAEATAAAAGARRRHTEVVARTQAGMGGGQQADGGSDGVIVWDAARRRFQTPDGLAYLEYREPRRDVMDLVHTYVPASKRGGGIAGQLCKAACAHARERNLRIVPTCSYVSDTFLPRNPEWRGLVYDAAGVKEQQQEQF